MTRSVLLLTAAKDEARCIGHTIESVVRQTCLPTKWVIVDDGSSDDTARIVREAGRRHPFIHLLSREPSPQRSFDAKDRALNDAFAFAGASGFDFIGVQDADISLQRADCFERLLAAFDDRPHLGIAGGAVHEWQQGAWRPRPGNSNDAVAGGLQVFRRSCYEQIGGYTPLHHGGEDWLAQLAARLRGWEVRVLVDQAIHHHRITSSAGGRCRGLFRLGLMDASFGSHPLFEVLKCARRLREKPLVGAALLRYCGYLWWHLQRRPPVIDARHTAYLRCAQRQKMASWFRQLTAPR